MPQPLFSNVRPHRYSLRYNNFCLSCVQPRFRLSFEIFFFMLSNMDISIYFSMRIYLFKFCINRKTEDQIHEAETKQGHWAIFIRWWRLKSLSGVSSSRWYGSARTNRSSLCTEREGEPWFYSQQWCWFRFSFSARVDSWSDTRVHLSK